MQIDHAIPLPEAEHIGGGRAPKWPWKHLAIGDSFLVPGRSTISTSYWTITTGFHYATRKVDGGIRVWRVK
jgi:hypothetical protein